MLKKHIQQVYALFNIVLMLFQTVAPAAFLVTPAYAATEVQEVAVSGVALSFDKDSNEFTLTGAASDAVDYVLSYRGSDPELPEEAVIGTAEVTDGTFSETIYAGTCSGEDCVADEVVSGTVVLSNANYKAEYEITDGVLWLRSGAVATVAQVELGTKYVAPQNDDVTITFTKLPENPGTLSIEEITLTDEQVAELGALSTVAYDITSSMEDGTFEYELTLPRPEGSDETDVKYAEDLSSLKSANYVESLVVGKQQKVSGLTHFTIFVVTTPSALSGQACIDAGASTATDCYNTIQQAINAATNGSTIYVQNGNFEETLNLQGKSLTIDGAGKDVTIVDAEGLSGYAISNFGDDTTVRDLTLIGSNHYGFKVSHVDNVTLENIKVQDSGKTGIDLNTVTSASLSDIEVYDTAGGFGLMLLDSQNVTVHNISTSGNPWGGVSVQAVSVSPDNIVFSGSFSAAETAKFLLEKDPPTYPAFGSVTTPSSLGYVVYTFREGDDYMQWYYQESLADAKNFAMGLMSSGLFSYTDILIYNTAEDTYWVLKGMKIQDAIDASTDNDQINILAGLFTENITVNKNVDLIGVGSGSDSNTNTVLQKESNLRVINLEASGADSTDKLLIKDLRIEPVNVYGLEVRDDKTVSHVELNNVHIVGTNQNNDTESETGFKVSTNGSIDDFYIVDSAFDHLTYGWYFAKHGNWGPGGSNATNITVESTSFSYNDAKGLYVEKLSDTSFSNVSVIENGRNTAFWNNDWNAGFDINLKGEENYQNISVTGSSFSGNAYDVKEGAALEIKARDDGSTYGAHPATLSNVTITGNTVTNNERGIRLGEPGKNNAGPTNVVVTNNIISGNAQTYIGSDGSYYGGLINMSVSSVDGSKNWWGDASGPDGEGPGTGDAVSTNVSYCPWLTSNDLNNPSYAGDCLGKIIGRTFIDKNNNGLRLVSDGDHPDGRMDGFTVRLYDSSWNFVEEQTTPKTAEVGQYTFEGLLNENNTYRVCGVEKVGYNQSPAALGQHVVNVNNQTPSGYADAVVVENQSSASDEFERCWETTLDGNSAAYLGVGYTQANPETPEMLGFNLQNSSSLTDTPVDLVCGASVNGSVKTSATWTDVSSSASNVKYIRHNQRPGGLNDIILGQSSRVTLASSADADNMSVLATLTDDYDNFYAGWGTFGGNEGTYKTRVRAYSDLNSNNRFDEGEPISEWSNFCEINYDKSAPTTPQVLGFVSPDLQCNAITNIHNTTVDWTDSTDSGAGFDHYEYNIDYPKTNGTRGVWSTNLTQSQYSGSLNEGAHHIKVRSVDVLGNTSGWSNTCTITTDWQAPDVEVTTPTAGIVHGMVDVRGTVTDDNPHHYWFVIQNSIGQTVAGPGVVNDTTSFTDKLLLSWDTSSLPSGDYTIKLEARDAADNKDAGSRSWVTVTVDNTVGVPTITAPTAGEYFNVNTIRAEWTEVTDPSGMDKYEIKYEYLVNGVPTVAYREVPASRLYRDQGLSGNVQGDFTIQVRAYDALGNVGAWSDAVTYTYDTVNPSSVITTFNTAQSGEEVETNSFDGLIEGTATDATSGVAKVDLEIMYTPFGSTDSVYWNHDTGEWQAGVVQVPATGTDTWSYQIPEASVEEGIYDITSHATDNAGNVETTYTIKIVYDKTIPEVVLTIDPATPDGNNGWYKLYEPEITLTASDNYDVDYIEYQWNTTTDGNWTTYTGPIKPPSQRQNILYYRAVDSVGNVSDLGVKDVRYDNTDPADYPLNVRVENITADDADGVWERPKDDSDVTRYVLEWKHQDGTVRGATVGRDTFKHKLDQLKDGVWEFSVKAMDDAGNFKESKVSFRVGPEPSTGTETVLGVTDTIEGDSIRGAILGARSNGSSQEDEKATDEGSEKSGSEEAAEEGEVLGATSCSAWKYYLPLILLALQLLSILAFEFFRRTPGLLKLGVVAAITVGVVAVFYVFKDAGCYVDGSWLAMITQWFPGLALVTAVVTKLLAYGFIEEA
ncbi:MAG: right-handed parallel beta-helix repeat-containing protein [Pseudomonadales bacterium]|nr:right-handed parallel beta-helix repeat-containing protein [Pseudomonadales bacterium]